MKQRIIITLTLLLTMTFYGIAQVSEEFEVVIELRNGTKQFVPVADDYPIIEYMSLTDGTWLRFNTGENVFFDVKCDDISQLYTQQASSVTVTAKSYTITQGDAIPTFEYTTSGVELVGTPVLTCEANSESPAGTYTIVVNRGTISNENVAFVTGTLTILENNTTILVKADAQTMKYGDEAPKFTYTVEGGSIKGVPEISCDASSTSPVGSYLITIEKGTISNNNVAYIDNYLRINEAPLKVKVKSYTINIGDPMPTFEFEYTGFKNGETETILSGQPFAEVIDEEKWVSIDDSSTPGIYTIFVRGLLSIDGNYTIEGLTGKLIIQNPDSPTILMGDVNGDYDVNVIDVVDIINYIHGNSPASFNITAADLNGDSNVDEKDLTMILNIIMKK